MDGRAKKINYFFINYKAILNVTKYKLDHMRQKLESREKDDVHRTQYKCTYSSCNKNYEDIDIGKIFNPITDEMRYLFNKINFFNELNLGVGNVGILLRLMKVLVHQVKHEIL